MVSLCMRQSSKNVYCLIAICLNQHLSVTYKIHVCVHIWNNIIIIIIIIAAAADVNF